MDIWSAVAIIGSVLTACATVYRMWGTKAPEQNERLASLEAEVRNLRVDVERLQDLMIKLLTDRD